MKFKSKYKLRTVCGVNVLVSTTGKIEDMNKVINLNDTALLIYQTFNGKEFSEDDVSELIASTYKIENSIARNDAHQFCQSLINEGVVEG